VERVKGESENYLKSLSVTLVLRAAFRKCGEQQKALSIESEEQNQPHNGPHVQAFNICVLPSSLIACDIFASFYYLGKRCIKSTVVTITTGQSDQL
jgi:hypothetical protein